MNNKPHGACDCGDHVWTAVTRGFVAFADAQALATIAANSWHITVNPRKNGARRGSAIVRAAYGRPMANVLLETDVMLDHTDRDAFNCRSANLRPATPAENSRNHGPKEGKAFKGVFKNRNKWRAAIWVGGANRYLGSYSAPEEAARAYDAAAKEVFGEFAWLNFPPEPLALSPGGADE